MKELNCLVGDKLPKFKAGALNGDILSNKNLLSSEFNLFNFWFIGCPPCIEELDELNELKQRSNLSILSFCRDSKEEIQNSDLDFSFPVVPAAGQLIEDVFAIPYGYPTNILTDCRGRIISVFLSIDKRYNSFAELDSIIGGL